MINKLLTSFEMIFSRKRFSNVRLISSSISDESSSVDCSSVHVNKLIEKIDFFFFFVIVITDFEVQIVFDNFLYIFQIVELENVLHHEQI